MTILTSRMEYFSTEQGLSALDTAANAFSTTFGVLIYVAVAGLLMSMLLVKSKMNVTDNNARETLHSNTTMH